MNGITEALQPQAADGDPCGRVRNVDSNPVGIVVVGQTPPPWGGQAVMIENLLRGAYRGIRLVHVPMRFSREMDQMGKFRVGKIFHLVLVVARILAARVRHGCRILYYPPAGHERLAIFRDIAILLLVRPFFSKLVLHFHASGLAEQVKQLPAPLRRLASRAYGGADCSIRVSEFSPEDGCALGSLRDVVVPYGTEDRWPHYAHAARSRGGATKRLLFVGLLGESKGVMVLLRACRALCELGVDIELVLAGHFESKRFKEECDRFMRDHGLQSLVHTPGVLTGDEKWRAFAAADVFCYPTFFGSEARPCAVMEAMQFCLPVVATHWRGMPSLVLHNKTGLLVAVRDGDALADALRRVITNPRLATEMGRNGRREYCCKYTIEHYHAAIERVFLSLVTT